MTTYSTVCFDCLNAEMHILFAKKKSLESSIKALI